MIEAIEKRSQRRAAGVSARRSRLALLVAAIAVELVLVGCTERDSAGTVTPIRRGDADSYVVSLGNLVSGRAPTQADVELSRFLFGTDPTPPVGPVKPVDIVARAEGLTICDGVLGGIVRWTAADRTWTPGFSTLGAPSALCDDGAGGFLVAYTGARLVTRVDAAGSAKQTFPPPDGVSFRPSGVARVGGEVWVSNLALHRIEVFDFQSGVHRRSIGQRGHGPGEFGLPMGLAVLPDGCVCAVDMLAARVQVFSPDGRWVRDIGGPGDRIGRFGRPRNVAAGPDGTVFVVDAASQRVHAFAADGQPLLAFGGPEEGRDALVLPAGIAISKPPLPAVGSLPNEFEPAYFVLVAEQLASPGIRVFAWRRGLDAASLAARTIESRPRAVRAATVANPHWSVDGCRACHAMEGGRATPIEKAAVDALCLSCHDGRKAVDEAHPIGRLAVSAQTRAPDGWPLLDGRVGCLTCHEIVKHCTQPTPRPLTNAALVRGFDGRDALASCANCHAAQNWRVNPHAPSGAVSLDRSCGFCHTTPTPQSPGGSRTGDAHLRAPTTQLCKNCHTMHADPAPNGHPGQLAYAAYRGRAASAEIPLERDRLTCATCHNPHPRGTFPSNSPLGRFSPSAADERKNLRTEHAALCISCHDK